jgi:methylated-DNA-[protein]-cysteine S-methyltransferase
MMSSRSFSDRVRAAVASIPKGKVATYRDIAIAVGAPGAARAVGGVMRTNKDTKAVPCHRVVASDGGLAGYAFGGLSAKQKILISEGVSFRGAKADLAASGWQPKTHIT